MEAGREQYFGCTSKARRCTVKGENKETRCQTRHAPITMTLFIVLLVCYEFSGTWSSALATQNHSCRHYTTPLTWFLSSPMKQREWENGNGRMMPQNICHVPYSKTCPKTNKVSGTGPSSQSTIVAGRNDPAPRFSTPWRCTTVPALWDLIANHQQTFAYLIIVPRLNMPFPSFSDKYFLYKSLMLFLCLVYIIMLWSCLYFLFTYSGRQP